MKNKFFLSYTCISVLFLLSPTLASAKTCLSNSDCLRNEFCSIPGPEYCFDAKTKNKFKELTNVSYKGVCSPLGESKTVGRYTTSVTYLGMSWWAAKNWCEQQNLALAPAPTDGYVRLEEVAPPEIMALGNGLVQGMERATFQLTAAMGAPSQRAKREAPKPKGNMSKQTLVTRATSALEQLFQAMWWWSEKDTTTPSLKVLETAPLAFLFDYESLQGIRKAAQRFGNCIIKTKNLGACEKQGKMWEEALPRLRSSRQSQAIAALSDAPRDEDRPAIFWLNHNADKDPCARYRILTIFSSTNKGPNQSSYSQISKTEDANPMDGRPSATSIPYEIWDSEENREVYMDWVEDITDDESANFDYTVTESEPFLTVDSNFDIVGTKPLCVSK